MIDTTLLLQALSEFNSRVTEKGTIADCPVCQLEGVGEGKLLLAPNGMLSCMRYAGHDETMRKEHRAAIMDALGINNQASFKDYDLEQGLMLRISKTQIRGKNQIILLEKGKTLIVDSVNLTKNSEREKFLVLVSKKIGGGETAEWIEEILTEEGQTSSMMQVTSNDEPERRFVGFFTLEDGRVGEMTKQGFAVYDPVSGETTIQTVVEYNGITYLLPRDPIFFKDRDEGIQLPENVVEYGNDRQLMDEIVNYVRTYVDMPDFDIRMAANYIKFTYLADKTYELPYFRIVGATGTQSRGSGKSRLAGVLGRACYRPFKVTSPSASSTFRIMDKYHPTLVIDEFNFSAGSDDAATMIMILNTGNMRGNLITRTERDEATGEMVVNGYSPYGPKVVGGLSLTESNAFESRAIRVEMRKTKRREDLEYYTSQKQLNDAARIRGMLTLWRLRNFSMNIEKELERAERALKDYSIEPRYIQIATPLYAMLNDESLEEELALMLVERTEDDAEERKLSMEGYLVGILHSMLFEQNDEVIIWSDKSVCIEGEPCDLLTVKDITNKYNMVNSDEKPVSAVAIAKKLSKMMLKTHTINRNTSTQNRKSAVVFTLKSLVYQFNQYNLPLPSDIKFVVDSGRESEENMHPEIQEAWNDIFDGTEDPLDNAHKLAKNTKRAQVAEYISSGNSALPKTSASRNRRKAQDVVVLTSTEQTKRRGNAEVFREKVAKKIQKPQIVVAKRKTPLHIVRKNAEVK